MPCMHYLMDTAGFVRDVLVGIMAARLDACFSPKLGALRARMRLRYGRPDFFWIPPVYRELPGYWLPSCTADPFTGKPFPAAF
jgi:hypothetical protein